MFGAPSIEGRLHPPSAKEKTPGFSFFHPARVSGRLATWVRRSIAPLRYLVHFTAGPDSKTRFFRFFTIRNLIANFHIKMVSWYGLCPLSGVECGSSAIYDASAVDEKKSFLPVLQSRTSYQNAIDCNNRKKPD